MLVAQQGLLVIRLLVVLPNGGFVLANVVARKIVSR